MAEKVHVHCIRCNEYILNVDPSGLSLPLKGFMFERRPDREWAYFPDSAENLDLVCPMCGWSFHEETRILTDTGIFEIPIIEPVVASVDASLAPLAITEDREVVSESVPESPQVSMETLGTETLTEPTSPQIEEVNTFSTGVPTEAQMGSDDLVTSTTVEQGDLVAQNEDGTVFPVKKKGRPFGSKNKRKVKRRKRVEKADKTGA